MRVIFLIHLFLQDQAIWFFGTWYLLLPVQDITAATITILQMIITNAGKTLTNIGVVVNITVFMTSSKDFIGTVKCIIIFFIGLSIDYYAFFYFFYNFISRLPLFMSCRHFTRASLKHIPAGILLSFIIHNS